MVKLEEFVRQKRLFWIVFAIGLALDLGSKAWAQAELQPATWAPGMDTEVVPIISGVLALKWAGNLGAAFSMLAGKRSLLLGVGVLALGVILYFVRKATPKQRVLLASLGLVASGAIGNLFDRTAYGYVRDFLYFDFDLPFHASVSFIPQRYPVFNVADIAILFGAVMLIFSAPKAGEEPEAG